MPRSDRAGVRASASARRTLKCMVRCAAIGSAVLAGLGAALLLTLGPTVMINGETRSCSGVIVTAETKAGIPDDEENVRTTPCDQARTRWTWYAAGLVLVSLVAGTGAAFYRPEDEPPVAAALGGPSAAL
jgi:hypothetical protein